MRRMLLYDRLGNPKGELAEADVFEATLREEINGEHSLEITTTHVLEKGSRLLYQDGRSKWREFVVSGVDAEHASGNRAIGTYYCVWSVQDDLQGVTVSVMPGVQSPVTAGAALTSLLSTTNRWNKGTVTNTATGGASMYDRSAWEALSTLIEVWGGEIDTTITVAANTGVTARVVDLYSQQGNQTAKRRFDFGHDLQSVKRTYTDEPLYCRISPRGAGEQTDAGGYGRKITIASVNSGRDYLEYSPMVSIARLPNGSGGYEYPTLIVENSNCKTPTELKTWAQSVLADYCTPKVSYEIDVLQAGIEGVDFSGVSLGDAVNIVDRKFSDDGLRVQGRVFSITTDLLNERDITIEIGSVIDSLSSTFSSMSKSYARMSNSLNNVQMTVNNMSTAQYISDLLDRINAEINATGGYTYITEGQGIRTYDRAVTNPLVGSEATKVVEIKGGSIRIANSKTAQGEWEWKTVFTSGHIAADLVTAANITSGFIGNANGDTYWDLDNSLIKIPTTTIVDNSTLGQMLTDAGAANAYVHPYGGGVLVGRTGNAVGALVNADGSFDVVQVTWSNGTPTVGTVYATYGDTMRVGKKPGTAFLEIDTNGVYLRRQRYSSDSVFDLFAASYDGSKSYYTIGARASGSTIGNGSVVLAAGTASGYQSVAAGNNAIASASHAFALGDYVIASGTYSFAIGAGRQGVDYELQASGDYSLAQGENVKASGMCAFATGRATEANNSYAAAFGYNTVAHGQYSIAEGNACTANGNSSHAMGEGTIAAGADQLVIGKYNSTSISYLFIIGYGTSLTDRKNVLFVTNAGNMTIAGTLTQNSDRRLKEHVQYLKEDASDFVRKLKPALFVKDGERHLGFYAQNVEEADEWKTATVKPEHTDDSLGFDPLTLDYSALIAPLTAYTQQLESKIRQLTKRIEALEANIKPA